MASELSGEALDDWLLEPDCPQCGGEDVVCVDTMPDGRGGMLKVWYCNKCGYTWTEQG